MMAFTGGAGGSAIDCGSSVITAPISGLSSRCMTDTLERASLCPRQAQSASDASPAAFIERIRDDLGMRDISLHEP